MDQLTIAHQHFIFIASEHCAKSVTKTSICWFFLTPPVFYGPCSTGSKLLPCTLETSVSFYLHCRCIYSVVIKRFILSFFLFLPFPPKFALISPPWKQAQSIGNTNTICRMISICGRLLFSAIWPTLLRFQVIKHFSQWPPIHYSSKYLPLANDAMTSQPTQLLARRQWCVVFLERKSRHLQCRRSIFSQKLQHPGITIIIRW